MVYLLVVQVGILCQYLANYVVICLKRSESVFLLNQIKSQSLVPIHLAYFGENLFVLLGIEYFESEKDDSDTEVWILLLEFSLYFIQNLKIFSFRMDLNNVSFRIIFSEWTGHGPELNSIVAIFYEFLAYIFHVGFEMLESKQNGKECDNFLLKQKPELDLLRGIFAVVFLVEHGDIGHEINQIFLSLIGLS